MENTDTLMFAAGGLLNGIAYLVIIVACILLVAKRKTGATVLMLASQLLGLLFFVASFAWTTISAHQGAESLVKTSKIIAMLGPLPHLLFAVGLLWFVFTLVKK
ncbi:hypothetical protein GTQ34_01995 [Muricauda sp. JGD-17]|uniref:Uncharacterized protein n=1 Tax=Flagellimonas ochracea TaxID=2696472 RepID=A0A964TAW7_9FLAO|nr:hypothetical protein [Allomuricauda ochracea]NAY90678.1 hypothetical protein [Allomuricauda ochracea]